MAIILTERAAEEVKRVIEHQGVSEDKFLRIGISAGGCSGFSYALGFDNQFDETDDTREEHHGVKIVVDKKSALYIEGLKIDFYESVEKRGFTFDNPTAVKSCGCGSSFQA